MSQIVIADYIPPHSIGNAVTTGWENYVHEKWEGHTRRPAADVVTGNPVYELYVDFPKSILQPSSTKEVGSFMRSEAVDAYGIRLDLSRFESFWGPVIARAEKLFDPNAQESLRD